MKIAFVQETVNQNVGVMYLSSILKSENHQCELFIEPLEKGFLDSVISYKPDIVGFSVITGAHRWALNTADRLKRHMPKAVIIFGGPHPTYFPEIINEQPVDAIARGEAELSLPEFVHRLENGKSCANVFGFLVKEKGKIYHNEIAPLVEDISSLPFPDHKLYLKYQFYQEQTEVPFSTTRGCPYNCSFCYNHVKAELYKGKGKYLRIRNIENVIREMELARKLYPKMRSIVLYDDIIGINREWLAEFGDTYAKRIGLPWFTSIRVDLINGLMAGQLARAKCFCLSIGVETGDEDLRQKVLGKRILNVQYVKAAEILRKAGIKIRTSNMLFLPGEDFQKALKTIDLNREMKVDFAWAYTLQPYPGTDIYDYAVKNGYLSASFQFDDIDPLGLLKPIITVKDKRKMLVLHRLFHCSVHSRIMRRFLKVFVLFPPNPLFDLLYSFSLIHSYAEYHQVSLSRAIRVAWNNYWSTKKRGL